MNMPGFSAEASLMPGTATKFGALRKCYYSADSLVRPQSLWACIQNCDQFCEGDIVGRCLPWCICRCRSGSPKKCGPIS
jgi:hypothetical protein